MTGASLIGEIDIDTVASLEIPWVLFEFITVNVILSVTLFTLDVGVYVAVHFAKFTPSSANCKLDRVPY